MLQLHLYNVYARALGKLSDVVLDEISNTMSYDVLGAEHSEKYIRGYWDGKKKFFKVKSQMFPTGLVHYFRAIMKKHNIPYQIVDDRVPPKLGEPISIKTLDLRPYQLETVLRSLEKQRGIVQCPTGSGKSLMMAYILGQLNLPSMIYIHRQDILFQLRDNFQKFMGVPVGIIGAGEMDIQKINVAMMQTVRSAFGKKYVKSKYEEDDVTPINNPYLIQDLVKNAECMMIDESHHVSAQSMWDIALSSQNAFYRYGFSATQFRVDNSSIMLEAAFARKIVEVSPSDLIKQGYLAKPTIYLFGLKHTAPVGHLTYPEVYKQEVVLNSERNYEIVKIALKFIEAGKSVLVAVTQIQHGKILERLLRQYARSCDKNRILFVSGGSGKEVRKKSLRDLDTKGYKCLICTTIFGEGVDIQSLDALINCKCADSSVDTVQLTGRALRVTDTKKIAYIVDFYDVCKYLKSHSMSRKAVYEAEPEFDLHIIHSVDEIQIKK